MCVNGYYSQTNIVTETTTIISLLHVYRYTKYRTLLNVFVDKFCSYFYFTQKFSDVGKYYIYCKFEKFWILFVNNLISWLIIIMSYKHRLCTIIGSNINWKAKIIQKTILWEVQYTFIIKNYNHYIDNRDNIICYFIISSKYIYYFHYKTLFYYWEDRKMTSPSIMEPTYQQKAVYFKVPAQLLQHPKNVYKHKTHTIIDLIKI